MSRHSVTLPMAMSAPGSLSGRTASAAPARHLGPNISTGRGAVPGCIFTVAAAALLASCASSPDRDTLGELHEVPPDVAEVELDNSLDLALNSYRRFLEETPEGRMTPEAMRRLADLQLEREFGIIGDGKIVEMEAPPTPLDLPGRSGTTDAESELPSPVATGEVSSALHTEAVASLGEQFGDSAESDEDFEARAGGRIDPATTDTNPLELPEGAADPSLAGPLEAIRIYEQILADYPSYERNDQVLYQMARAYDEIGQPDEAMAVMNRLVEQFGYSRYLDEVHFRRGEYLFMRRKFRESETAYQAIISMGSTSSYYELALYKMGWALYKQEFYEEALHRFVALLDYRLSTGYDFDQDNAENDERRVADTFRVVSLSFSNLGGPEVINEYFASFGHRSFEDRIYSNLGEFYLDKLRYHDAAEVYNSFVDLYPYHRVAPRFSMRVVDIYAEGGFPLLVVEAKKAFASDYGISSDYWQYFDITDSPEVVGFLKTNLTDLANHYHALYQDESLEDDRQANFAEAERWYREFLTSFPADYESPGINYQLADLLLENENFGQAALEYERTAYEYEPHEQASAAGYAAIYAHRENLKLASEAMHDSVLRATVTSSLRFADTFPEHENADVVLGAAADDLYEMGEYETAILAGSKLIERYPTTDPELLRSAWTVVAHSSFDLELYADAERAYTEVLRFVPEDDEAHAAFVDNLAASIYQQGVEANEVEDYRAAANHFLRVKQAAPTSEIRSSAEYDAAAALVRLEDWTMAAQVLEDFRAAFPDHELQGEATKQLASVYRQGGELDRSAEEYQRVAAESDDPELRREATILAADLYEEAGSADRALDAYLRYVADFPRPLDVAQETRFKIAGMYEARFDQTNYRAMLEDIVAEDAAAGADRTDRSRFLAAQSALVLSEDVYDRFVAVKLSQPFEQSLAEKQQRMADAIATFEGLVDYQVGEVTAAATYHLAEIYYDFSQSLLESERPSDLSDSELVDYELAIEEEAFPFEEQAIEVHQQNYELISAGLYNSWVQQSIDRLGEMMPGRYAKSEVSSGFVGSVDIYAYRSPGATEVVAATEAADAE